MTQILGRGLKGNWLLTLGEPAVADAIWFTLWQALVSVLLCLIVALPTAYVLYRRAAPAGRVLRALITVPFALPTIITAIGFTVFQKQNVSDSISGMARWLTSPVFWILVAHLFVNFSVIVRTVGSAWVGLSHETEEAAALGGAGRLRIFWSISRPQLMPAIVSASATVFMYCAGSYGLILVLGGGRIDSICKRRVRWQSCKHSSALPHLASAPQGLARESVSTLTTSRRASQSSTNETCQP